MWSVREKRARNQPEGREYFQPPLSKSLGQPEPHRGEREAGDIVQPELAHEFGPMVLDGFLGDAEAIPDHFVRAALGDHLPDRTFAGRESLPGWGRIGTIGQPGGMGTEVTSARGDDAQAFTKEVEPRILMDQSVRPGAQGVDEQAFMAAAREDQRADTCALGAKLSDDFRPADLRQALRGSKYPA